MADQKQRRRAGGSSDGLSPEERAALKETIQERKAAKSRGTKASREDGENEVLAKISEMPQPDLALAQRIHAIVTASAPDLWPRTWYGMPAYARDGKVICFFQAASKFKVRYATFGFQPDAKLDDGAMWPTGFALRELNAAEEARISALVKKAVS